MGTAISFGLLPRRKTAFFPLIKINVNPSLYSPYFPSSLRMPYPILIARKQKRPPLPFTEGHQRHGHICSSVYLGSGVHFWSNSPAHPHRTMLCFSVKSMNRICFYWKQNPIGCSKNTPNVFKPWLVFSPWDKAEAGIKYKIPERSHPVFSSAVSLCGLTHPVSPLQGSQTDPWLSWVQLYQHYDTRSAFRS